MIITHKIGTLHIHTCCFKDKIDVDATQNQLESKNEFATHAKKVCLDPKAIRIN